VSNWQPLRVNDTLIRSAGTRLHTPFLLLQATGHCHVTSCHASVILVLPSHVLFPIGKLWRQCLAFPSCASRTCPPDYPNIATISITHTLMFAPPPSRPPPPTHTHTQVLCAVHVWQHLPPLA